MRTTNGLNVPTGWGTEPPAERQACPVCHHAADVVTNVAGYRVLAVHTRRREDGRHLCGGSGRLTD